MREKRNGVREKVYRFQVEVERVSGTAEGRIVFAVNGRGKTYASAKADARRQARRAVDALMITIRRQRDVTGRPLRGDMVS